MCDINKMRSYVKITVVSHLKSLYLCDPEKGLRDDRT